MSRSGKEEEDSAFNEALFYMMAVVVELKDAKASEAWNLLLKDRNALRAELKQAHCANQELRDLNVAGKKLGDWIDLTSKLTAAESRAEEAERSEEAMSEKVRSLAPHGTCACSYDKPGDVCMHHSPQLVEAEARAEQWERKFNDDGPRCKVRTDSKEGRFIAPTDCGKEDLEQRLARVREVLELVAKDDFCAYTHTARKALKELEGK
jgi:hypothetical protein